MNMNIELTNKIEQTLKDDTAKHNFREAVEAMAELVQIVESRPMTTKGHYGSYLSIAKDKTSILILLCAGANKDGVRGAAMINGITI